MAKDNIITTRVPEGTHVEICRGPAAATAEYSILPDWQINTLKGFLELHILQALKNSFCRFVTFEWRYPAKWRDILALGQDVEIAVFPGDDGNSELVKIRLISRIQVQVIRENTWSPNS